MPDSPLRKLPILLPLMAAMCLSACGDKKAMQERLKAAETEAEKIQAEYETLSKEFGATKRDNSEMENLLFTQVDDPGTSKKKTVENKKKLTVETAADILRERSASLAQQKEALERECKSIEAELAAYRARFNK